MSTETTSKPNEKLRDQSPDKTIVERRVAHAGDKSRQAVRDLRKGFSHPGRDGTNTNHSFSRDMLARHSASQQRAHILNICLIAIGATIATQLVEPMAVAIWLVVILGVTACCHFMAKKFKGLDNEAIDVGAWYRKFAIELTVKSCVWAVLFALVPLHAGTGHVSVMVLGGALLTIALSLTWSRHLKFGVLLCGAPVIAVVSFKLAMTGNAPDLGMALLLVGVLMFIHLVGDESHNVTVSELNSRAERDQLIMQLEDSRAISEEARRRAEDANLAKSRFLATMSHELRTPLNAILGFSEVMTNEVMGPIDNPHYKEYLGDIHRSGAHLLKLINEILDLSRVEAGRYELNEEATNLAYAAEESQQMIKLKANQKKVQIVMQIQPDLPQIWADARAVRQVILNLLSNALKFTPQGGTIWLKVGWTAGGGQYVSIKDTGPGIPEDEIPIVLSSFGQGSIAIKSAEQGTGLGLPIVQALVHMHDGSFELKSKLREGTEVIATFPRARVMEVMPAMPVDAGSPNSMRGHVRGLRKRVEAPPLQG